MGNSPNKITRSTSLADLLATAVSDGTYADVIETTKTDASGQEAAATDIAEFAGQLVANLWDDATIRVVQMYDRGTKVWLPDDAAARDALGSDDDLEADAIAMLADTKALYYCVSVDGGSASTWAALPATGNISGPGVTTDNAVVRWDGALGGTVQNSVVVISDAGAITGVASIAVSGNVDGRDVSADGATLDAHVASIANPHQTLLSQVLDAGNDTAGFDIILTNGDEINGEDGGHIRFAVGTGVVHMADTEIAGNLTVSGFIDPSALAFTEQPTNPWPTTPGYLSIWAKDDIPNTLWYTDGAGNDHQIADVESHSLAQILIVGNTTGGTSIVVTSGDILSGEPGVAGPGGAVPVVGGDGDGANDGGAVSVTGGMGGSTGDGGAVVVAGGAGGGTSGTGGDVIVQGGNASAGNSDGGDATVSAGQPSGSGDPGDVTILATDALGGNTAGGIITMAAGIGAGTQVGGAITGLAGAADPAGTGAGGPITWTAGAGGGTSGAGGAASVIAGAASGGNSLGGNAALTGGAGRGTQAGGNAIATAGVGGATGVGGTAAVVGGAGGATSGAGGPAYAVGGAGTNGNSAGGEAGCMGGAGQGSAAGGTARIQGGTGGDTGTGGTARVRGGDGGASSGTGGVAEVIAGAGSAATATGGAASVTGGAAGSGAATGGAVSITSGAGGGTSGNSGAVSISSGAVTSGTRGSITIDAPTITLTASTNVAITNHSYHSVRGATARGSTNTLIYRWTSVVDNVGSDITYTDSATNGGSWGINTNGVYAVSCSIDVGHNGYIAIKKAAAVSNTFDATDIQVAQDTAANNTYHLAWTGFCSAGDDIWIATDAATNPTGAPVNNNRVTVVRIR